MWRRMTVAPRWRRAAAPLTLGLALLMAACAPLGGGPTPTPTVRPTPTKTPTPPCVTWQVIPSPTATRYPNSYLLAVSALSPSAAWAVGATFVGEGPVSTVSTLIEQWDGSTWRIVASPGSGYLYGVAAVSLRDAWTVGEALSVQGGESRVSTLIERWNGAQWSAIPSPNPSAVYSALKSVAAVSANDVWAVGAYRSSASVTLPLFERWDGTAWRVVAGPALPGVTESDLSAVARIPGTSQLWAVGYTLNGPRPAYEQGLIEQWDGSVWQVVAGPTLPAGAYGSLLTGIVALSATDAWAVGHYTASNHTDRTLTAHWDGTSWKLVANPDTWGSLASVAAAGPHDVLAGGGVYITSGEADMLQTLIMRWNGAAWATSATPTLQGATPSDILAVAIDGAGGFWAVGYVIQPDTRYNNPLIERCT